jgi:hypothetical protein
MDNAKVGTVLSSMISSASQSLQARGYAYRVGLIATICLAFILLMVIPYWYDQYNREMFATALNDKNLVVQEFVPAFISNVMAACSATQQCDLLQVFGGKKLIALDYVYQMEKATKLDILQFVSATALVLVVLAIFSWLLSGWARQVGFRFLVIVGLFFAAISVVHLVFSLPHTNVKFYYVFGLISSLVIGAWDYLHNIDIIEEDRTVAKFEAIALQERHKKWTSILGYSLAIISLIIGTISFNSLAYIRVTFGDSFVLAPIIGISIMCGFVILVYVLGIVGNIRKILREIETTIRMLSEHSP